MKNNQAGKSISVPLSARLQTVVSMVTPGNRAADIGCDHGYTAICLRNAGISPACICSDINAGPLEAARENIRKYGASGIRTVCADGLAGLTPGEAESIVIAGMGGELMCRILEEGKNVAQASEELVLGPQSEPEKLRTMIYELDFYIIDERFVFEDGKYYPVIRAVRRPSEETVPAEMKNCSGEEFSDALRAPDETELRYGPVLLRKRDGVLKQYLDKEKKQFEKALENLRTKGAGGEKTCFRRKELEQLLERNARAQEYYR